MQKEPARKHQVTFLTLLVMFSLALASFKLAKIEQKIEDTSRPVGSTVTRLNYQEVASAAIRAWQRADQRADNGVYKIEVQDDKVQIFWDGASGEKVLLSEEPIRH